MSNWQNELVQQLPYAEVSSYWRNKTRQAASGNGAFAVHLAILAEPFLSLLLEGTKTIESRFTKNRVAPYGAVSRGDLLLLKGVGGPVVGFGRVGQTWSIELQRKSDLKRIRRDYSTQICATGEEFWRSRAEARFVTLMEVTAVTRCDPIECQKRDRRGWVILKSSQA